MQLKDGRPGRIVFSIRAHVADPVPSRSTPVALRRDFFRRRQLISDLAFGNFTQRHIFWQKFFERLHERAVAAFELLHANGNNIHENIRIVDYLKRGLKVVVSHNIRLVSRLDVLGESVIL
jgi:hypothetical protein